MQITNTAAAMLAAAIIALAAAILYAGTDRPLDASTPDDSMASHHGGTQQNVSLAPLQSLLNAQVPNFSLTDRNGTVYSPDTLRGKNTILFFNEGLMCYPSCWNQIVALAEDARFKDAGVQVLSVVVDSPEEWRAAISKMPALASAVVAFDTTREVSNTFGALVTPSSMHPGAFPGHTYVLIDANGVVTYVLDDPNMGIHNDELWAKITK